MAGRGSGSRRASVNSHSTGYFARRRCFTARAQPINPSSMAYANVVAANLEQVRARIAAAAAAAGRDPAAITLVAVSKTHPAEAVAAALAAGQTVFGENRLQEAQAKFEGFRQARLHLIGPLQTNKVRDAVRLCQSIDTLDRDRLSNAIARAAETQGHVPDLLVQVNIGDEPQKAGIATSQADAFIRSTRNRFGAALQGLMCIPPADTDPAPFFRHLSALADEHGLLVRSMGMSNDYEIAIKHGATHVRVGSAIFGSRPTERLTMMFNGS